MKENSISKSVLVILLPLVLLLGMLPTAAAAETVETPVYKAAYSASAEADGSLQEQGWSLHGRLGMGED